MKWNLLDFANTIAYASIYNLEQIVNYQFSKVQQNMGAVFNSLSIIAAQLPLNTFKKFNLTIEGKRILPKNSSTMWFLRVGKPHHYVLLDKEQGILEFAFMGMPLNEPMKYGGDHEFLKKVVVLIRLMKDFTEEAATQLFRMILKNQTFIHSFYRNRIF